MICMVVYRQLRRPNWATRQRGGLRSARGQQGVV